MPTISFERFAGLCAILTGILGFVYSLSFIVISPGNPKVGVGLAAGLIVRGKSLPTGLGWLGIVTGLLLVAIYAGRLIVLSPTSPVVAVPAVLAGFLANPIFYLWLGAALWRGKQ